MAGRTAAPRLRCSGGIWYECSRRKVKKLNLRVRRDGSVAVSIPLRMDWAQADRFVAEQAQWIAEAQARQLARAERQTETVHIGKLLLQIGIFISAFFRFFLQCL